MIFGMMSPTLQDGRQQAHAMDPDNLPQLLI
jgi:hypothetical protein